MKSFLKFTLATIVGVLITFFIILIFFIVSIASLAPEKEVVKVKENSILYIDFKQQITDRASNNPMENINFSTFKAEPKLGLDEILENIQKAKEDKNIKGIYIELSDLATGIAIVEEIRNALIDFKESGKFIISYSDFFTQKGYYFASVSDKIYVNPQGLVEFKGLRAEVMFYKNALEKIGVEPQVIRHGKFKSAIEPLILDGMSEANKEQTITYVGSIWNHMLKGIAVERELTIDQLNMYADKMLITDAQAAVDNKLIDGIKYKDEILAELMQLTDKKEDKDLNFIKLGKYKDAPKIRKNKGFAKDKIAVIYALGQIDMGKGSETTIGSEGLSTTIREARQDSSIKAIVLRINSPGGSALASEVIWREVVLAKQVKPVIVSMGDVAASGGYYIAAPADVIVAQENTITGSIGVFGVLWNGQNLLNDKLGVTVDGVQTNENSGIGSVFRPMTAGERDVVQQSVENIYDVFITHVAEGRGMTKEQVDNIGQGRVWSGINAKEIGLVDRFGGLELAIEIAAEKAGLENYRTLSWPKQKDPFQQLIESFTSELQTSILEKNLGHSYKYYRKINDLTKIQGLQARMPYEVELY